MRDLAIMWMETHYERFFSWLGGHPEQARRFSRAMASLTRVRVAGRGMQRWTRTTQGGDRHE